DNLRWINAARLLAPSPCEEVRRLSGDRIRTHWMVPGDRLVGDQIRPMGGRRPTTDELDAAVRTVFSVVLSQRRERHEPDEPRLARILAALRANAAARAARVLHRGESILCRIDLRDMPEASFLVEADARGARIERCERLRLAPMVLTTRVELLEALATQDYGDEAITMGCGATLQLRRRDLPLHRQLVLLLGRRALAPGRRERVLA